MELATPISYVIRITLGVQDILMSSNEMDPEKLPVLPVTSGRYDYQPSHVHTDDSLSIPTLALRLSAQAMGSEISKFRSGPH
jgi:hypothetical protein